MKNDLYTWLVPSTFSWFDQSIPAVFLGSFCVAPSSAKKKYGFGAKDTC